MRENIRITSGARADLKRAFAWYERQAQGVGVDFLDRVGEVLELVSRHPLSFPKRSDGFHRALLRPFSYAVFFQPFQEIVLVAGVIHTSREPESISDLLKRRI